MIRRWKDIGGVILKDARRYLSAQDVRRRYPNGDPGWVRVRNRSERLVPNPKGPGVQCDWAWSSRLHACEVLPLWGRRLMSRSLRDWPIRFADSPPAHAAPAVSFVFAHCGEARLPQLQSVIRSAFAQRRVSIECVVVDLTPASIIDRLPHGTVGVHVPTGHIASGWYKSWAFNIGARLARADVLVFHDGDILMPRDYAAALAKQFEAGRDEVASLQRFLFYLPPSASRCAVRDSNLGSLTPEFVCQNWKGGTLAVRRDRFFRLGGYDEGFVDWGGEDDELYDRCGTTNHHRYGFIPFVHLWHEPQPLKQAAFNPNVRRVLPDRLAIPAARRVTELCARSFGSPSQPDPKVSYLRQLAVSP